MVVEVVLL